MKKFKDYSKTRFVIDNPKFYYGSHINAGLDNAIHKGISRLYLSISDKIRREMGICGVLHHSDFRVIIVRKDKLKGEIDEERHIESK